MNWKRSEPSAGSFTGIAFKWSSVSLILAAALMLLSLPGCSRPYGVILMDSRLTAPCDRPQFTGETYRDGIEHAIRLEEALEDCADRIDAIRRLTR
jgi:hypothetical protein